MGGKKKKSKQGSAGSLKTSLLGEEPYVLWQAPNQAQAGMVEALFSALLTPLPPTCLQGCEAKLRRIGAHIATVLADMCSTCWTLLPKLNSGLGSWPQLAQLPLQPLPLGSEKWSFLPPLLPLPPFSFFFFSVRSINIWVLSMLSKDLFWLFWDRICFLILVHVSISPWENVKTPSL